MSRLMVIIPDRLSDLVRKGEVTPRYYNPGNTFQEIHIVLLNDDAPDIVTAQPMFGDAFVTVHNIIPPRRHFVKTAGWHPFLMQSIEQKAVKLARKVCPDVVRSFGSQISICLARAVQHELSIPWVASLHNNLDATAFPLGALDRLRRVRDVSICTKHLRYADAVLPVYPAISPFLERIGVKSATVCFNALSEQIAGKTNYEIKGRPAKLVSVGRLIPGKNPENIIRAIERTDATLTIIGDGPLAERLRTLGGRVTFIPSMDNAEVCRTLHTYDLFVTNCDYPGIPKTTMEAMLAGLPIITNFPKSSVGSDMSDPEAFVRADDSPQSYRFAIDSLVKNQTLRERRGRSASVYAKARWSPRDAEAKVAEIYAGLTMDRSNQRNQTAASR